MYKDLKATHLFLDEQMRITLIDFGLSEQLTEVNTAVPGGTLHAMSPEMLVLYTKVATGQQDKVDYSKDLVTCAHDYYTIGVLILELIDANIVKYFRPDQTSQQSHIQRLTQYFQSRVSAIYSVDMFEHNSDISPEFLDFIQSLLVPEAGQRLATKEAIFQHSFIQQEAGAVDHWEAIARGETPEGGILHALGLTENKYVAELHNLISLSTDEQIDDDDDDDEELTAE